jgi:hypothetical protein
MRSSYPNDDRNTCHDTKVKTGREITVRSFPLASVHKMEDMIARFGRMFDRGPV